MTRGKKLTLDDKMATMLAMIRRWQPPPSIDDMMRATELKSTSTINHRLDWLETEGYIKKNPGTKRTFTATQKGMDTFPELVVLKRKHGQPGTDRE